MKSFAWYDLQVIICSAIMMLYYFVVLRNKRFHQYNRFYILATFFLSFIIPLIKIQLDKVESQKAVIQFMYVVADYNAVMDKAVAEKGFQVNWSMMAVAAYVLVSVFFLFAFMIALWRIRKLLKQYHGKSLGEIYLIFTNVKGTPFSFFKYIFWNEEIDLQSSTGQKILQHELTHVKEKHSIDNVITQVVMIFGWFNPFFWIARKELYMIHEFIADKKSVDNGDAASLAEMLLTATYPQQQFLLTNSFFFSPIKRRLLMITNNKNPRFSYLRRVVVLPLMAVVVLLFAFRMKQENNQHDALAKENVAKNNVDKKLFINDTTTKDTTNPTISKASVIVINGERVTHDDLSKINPNEIQSMNVLKGKEAIDKYGNEGTKGAIEIKLKPVYVLDGKRMTNDFDLNKISSDKIESVNVLKGTAAGFDYGDEGKRRGVVLIKMKPSAKPLYVVDGKKMPKDFDIDKLNPANIVIINVLKEEAAVKKYGDEGKNGVVELKMKPLLIINGRIMPNDVKFHKLIQKNAKIYSEDEAIAKYGEAGKYGAMEITTENGLDDSSYILPSANAKMIKDENNSYDKIFTVVQTPAEFPGGLPAWQKFLVRNLNIDLPVKNGAPPGKYKVDLSFIVDDKGIVSRVKAENDPGFGTAAEAVRVVQKGPMWIPAKQNGQNVTSLRKQSITFVVSEEISAPKTTHPNQPSAIKYNKESNIVIAEKFGVNEIPNTKLKGKNDGIVIRNMATNKVNCLVEGRVTAIFQIEPNLKSVILKSGDYYTVYNNLTNIDVEKGQKIEKGTAIGTVIANKSGNYEFGFSVLNNKNKFIDPETLLVN